MTTTDLAPVDQDQPGDVAIPAGTIPAGASLQQWLADAHAADQLARGLLTSQWVPAEYKSGPQGAALGNAIGAILLGFKLDLDPITALQSVHMIKGRPSISVKMMVAIMQRAGHRVRWTERTAERCTVVGRRRDWPADEPDVTITITIDEAKAAGWTSNALYQSRPQDMLYYRAAARVCEAIGAAELRGLISADDAEDLPEAVPAPVRVTAVQALGLAAAGAEISAELVAERSAETARQGAAVMDGPPLLPGEQPEPPVVEAEPPADSPTVTAAQLRKIGALCGDLDLKDRAVALAVTSRIVGREIGSRNDLTKGEATVLIDTLTANGPAIVAELLAGERPAGQDGEQLPDPADGNDPWAGAGE